MKLSSALCLALALGWARENASYTPLALPKGRRRAFSFSQLSSSSSPHPPDEPPPNKLLNLYFASTPPREPPVETPPPAPEQPLSAIEEAQLDLEVQLEEEPEEVAPLPLEEDVVQGEPTPTPAPVEAATTTTISPAPTYIPAKPWMTEEQKEEINAAANRFVQEVWVSQYIRTFILQTLPSSHHQNTPW